MHTLTNPEMVKEYMWALSNIAADNTKFADLILMNKDIFNELTTNANHPNVSLRAEAVTTICIILFSVDPVKLF